MDPITQHHEAQLLADLGMNATRIEVLQEQQRELVRCLRLHEVSWENIGQILGITKQGAQQRFSA